MNTLYLILLIAAAVCFFLAAAGVAVRRTNLVALGLLLVTLMWIIQLVDGPGIDTSWRKTNDREVSFEVPRGG